MRSIFVLLTAMLVTHAVSAELAWDKRIGADDTFHRPAAIAYSSADATYVIAGTAFQAEAGERPPAASLRLWRVSASGEMLREITLPAPGAAPGFGLHYRPVNDVVILGDGSIVLAPEFARGRAHFVRVSATGEILQMKALAAEDGDLVIHRILVAPDGNLLLLGRHGADGLVLKVDHAGAELWRKKLDRGKFETATDGFLSGSQLVVVGDSGEFKPYFVASVWMLELNADGSVQREATWPGRAPAVAQSNGELAVAYDASLTGSIVRVRALSAALEMRWERDLGGTTRGLPGRPRIAGDKAGFLVASDKAGGLVLHRLDRTGAVVVEHRERASFSFHGYPEDVVTVEGAQVVLTTVAAEAQPGRPAFKIGLVRAD